MDYICLMVKYCIGRMRRVYFMTFPESKRDYKKSRIYYTISECAAQSIIQLAGGTFLAALLTYVGVSSGNIGVITSLVSLAAVSQIFAITIANRLKKFKLFVCIAAHFRILLAVVFFVPLLSVSRQCQVGLVVGLYLVAQIMIQIATPATQDWIASLVPYGLRGRYLSIKDAWVVIFLSVSTLLAGIILDVLKKDNILIGFVIVGILVLILALVNIITLTLMKEPKLSYVNSEGKEMHGSLARRNKNVAEVQNKECFIAEIKEAMNSVGFLKVLILNLLWITAFYIATPFEAAYQINELNLSYTFISFVSFICSIIRILITPRLGRMGDCYGMARVLKYLLGVYAMHYLVFAFTVPQNAYGMNIVASLCAAVAWAFISTGLFCVQLEFLDETRRIKQLGLIAAVTGIHGFVISWIGAKLLSVLQKVEVYMGATHIYAQQILFLLGFIATVITIVYTKCVVQKKSKVYKNQ